MKFSYNIHTLYWKRRKLWMVMNSYRQYSNYHNNYMHVHICHVRVKFTCLVQGVLTSKPTLCTYLIPIRRCLTNVPFVVTEDNILSSENKARIQSNLTKIDPARSVDGFFKNKDFSRAAVLIPMCCVNGVPSLLFMVRAGDLRSHRGEVSFPGGKMDDGDSDLTFTALRETNEEIGLPVDQVDIWGQMRPAPNRTGKMLITPIIGYCGDLDIHKLQLNKNEVESVFTCSIASLCDPKNTHSTQFRPKERPGYTLPVYLGQEYRIWGLSAIFVHQFLTLVATPGLYKFKLRHRA